MKNITPNLYAAILEQVRQMLQSNQLTQAQIGKALGMKQSAVSYLLKGKTRLSLEQFLDLSELIGQRPQQIIAQAEASLTEKKPMPAEKEAVLTKSMEHYLCYFSAVKPMKVEDFVGSNFSENSIRLAVEDLIRADLVEKLSDGSFRQKQVNVIYTPPSERDRLKRNRYLMDLHQICQKNWFQNFDNQMYRASKFNYYMLDQFTPTQIREVTEALWRVHEKLRAIQKQNMANDYASSTEKFTLWQAHLMLVPPLEDK